MIGRTGTNNIPLGKVRIPENEAESRGRTETRVQPLKANQKSKSDRWGIPYSENRAAEKTRLPVFVTGLMTPEQIEAYALHFRMEEVTQRLRMDDVVPPEKDRSPSPAPIYDNKGIRTNTRVIRYREKLEEERHTLVDRAIKIIPNFKPPSDYRRPGKVQEKIYIPAQDFPEINFVGHLLGPRGHTLKQMERESGAKINIRGAGSVKEGKGRTDLPGSDNFDDDLHCIITGDDLKQVQKAISLINKIVETLASTPEASNDLKKGQLRELATLNGTLRVEDVAECTNCGEIGHRRYECPHRKNLTATIVCHICGAHGHFAKDCKERKTNNGRRTAADQEYEQLMDELRGGNGANKGDKDSSYNSNISSDGRDPSSTKPWLNNNAHKEPYKNYRDNRNNYDRDGANRDDYERRDYGGRGRRNNYGDNSGGYGGNNYNNFNRNNYNKNNYNKHNNYNNNYNNNGNQYPPQRSFNNDRGSRNFGRHNNYKQQPMPGFVPESIPGMSFAVPPQQPAGFSSSITDLSSPAQAPPGQIGQSGPPGASTGQSGPPGLAPPGLGPPGIAPPGMSGMTGMIGMAGLQGLSTAVGAPSQAPPPAPPSTILQQPPSAPPPPVASSQAPPPAPPPPVTSSQAPPPPPST